MRESLSWRPLLQSGGGSTKLSRDKLAATETTNQRQSADTDMTWTYINGRAHGDRGAFTPAFYHIENVHVRNSKRNYQVWKVQPLLLLFFLVLSLVASLRAVSSSAVTDGVTLFNLKR